MAPITRNRSSGNCALSSVVHGCPGVSSSKMMRVKAAVNGNVPSSNWFLTNYNNNEFFRNLVNDFITERDCLQSQIATSLDEIIHHQQMVSLATSKTLKLKKELKKLMTPSKELEELNDPIVKLFFNGKIDLKDAMKND